MRFIHTADLHLAASAKEYSLAVLADIGSIAVREKAEAIVFAGDIFDSFADAYTLRAEFARWADELPAAIQVIALPGNHEELNRGMNSLSALSFGTRVRLMTTLPLEIVTLGDTEFLCIPFQQGYLDPGSMAVPPQTAPSRVAVMHGTIAGMAYTGEGPEEEQNSFIDPSVFGRLHVCYAALGHLHASRDKRVGETLIVYPGSARVWRKGERGPRTVSVVDVRGGAAQHRLVPVSAAGEYRSYRIPLSLDGQCAPLDRLANPWGQADMVSLVLTGIVDDEHAVSAVEEDLRSRYAGRVRSLEVRSEVEPVAGIAGHPAAGRFLTLLAAQEGTAPAEVIERARMLGLTAIAGRMGGDP